MQYLLIIVLTIILVVVVGFVATAYYKKAIKSHISVKDHQQIAVYCLMVTGKDKCRIDFARKSVSNFLEQDYDNKVLVIINHSRDKVITSDTSDTLQRPSNIFEFYVDKDGNNLTLGELRNISLNMVPINAIWTTWDDDDVRSPTYISQLYSKMVENKSDVVVFTHRTEFNANNKFVWASNLKSGFPIVFAKADLRVQYTNLNSMEDLNIISGFKNLGKIVYTWADNDISLYIRTVHSNNTSFYVQKEKDAIITHSTDRNNALDNYVENSVSKQYGDQVREFMSRYYTTEICQIQAVSDRGKAK